MQEPIFLTLGQVDELHTQCIERFGGGHGTRDPGLLDAAVAMPRSQFGGEYLHATLPEMAAAYLFHLCQNHAYHDGNKRVALAAALTFLRINGHTVDATPDELEELTLGVARGERDKAAIAVFLAEHMRSIGA